MGKPMYWVFFAVVIWAAVAGGVEEGGVSAAAPPPEDPCLDYLFQLIDCVPYVEKGSNTSKPDPACCPELKPVLDDHPLCLCEIIKPNASVAGIDINTTRAMGLPALCGFKPFPVTNCPPEDVPSPPPPPPSPPTPTLPPSPALVPPSPSPQPPSPPSGSPPPSEGKGAREFGLSMLVALFSLAVAACSSV